jgi:aspartyl-tRNA(Asn)/glutamyl-tRNA(Gln) amidotransferase subunit B
LDFGVWDFQAAATKMSYLANIGLEVHVQLKTRSKMFCSCAVAFAAEPNTHTCPTCLGLPGGLPAMNHAALRLTVLTGLMLDCEIAPVSKFDRKNYFYPDMPKNYQISQYDQPLCANGRVSLHDLAYPKDAQNKIAAPNKEVPLVRIHLEEDVAKSMHLETTSGIDFNRAGTPLMEIVTQPEMNSPEEAFAFLTSLKQILMQGRVSDADMEKGQLRCDCNVSIRPDTQTELGAKVEIKNLNSISGVRRALAFEISRQTAVLGRGDKLEQQTRGWDDEEGKTYLMRTKESAHDYRYFPDPDLVPVKTEALVAEARALLPELPQAKRTRLAEQYGITAYDAAVLANEPGLARYFEAAAKGAKKPKQVANWILNDLQNALTSGQRAVEDCPVTPAALGELVELIETGRISGKQGKEVFSEMFATGRAPAEIVKEKGVEQLSDAGAIEKLCAETIAQNPKPAADYKAGNAASLNFLKGQVIKLSQGKANPKLVGEILERLLR